MVQSEFKFVLKELPYNWAYMPISFPSLKDAAYGMSADEIVAVDEGLKFKATLSSEAAADLANLHGLKIAGLPAFKTSGESGVVTAEKLNSLVDGSADAAQEMVNHGPVLYGITLRVTSQYMAMEGLSEEHVAQEYLGEWYSSDTVTIDVYPCSNMLASNIRIMSHKPIPGLLHSCAQGQELVMKHIQHSPFSKE